MRHWYGAKADPRIPRHGCASLRSSPRLGMTGGECVSLRSSHRLGMTGIFVECETRERRPNDRHQRRRWVDCAIRWLMPAHPITAACSYTTPYQSPGFRVSQMVFLVKPSGSPRRHRSLAPDVTRPPRLQDRQPQSFYQNRHHRSARFAESARSP